MRHPIRFLLIVLLWSLLSPLPGVEATWWNNTYDYCRPLTVTGNLTTLWNESMAGSTNFDPTGVAMVGGVGITCQNSAGGVQIARVMGGSASSTRADHEFNVETGWNYLSYYGNTSVVAVNTSRRDAYLCDEDFTTDLHCTWVNNASMVMYGVYATSDGNTHTPEVLITQTVNASIEADLVMQTVPGAGTGITMRSNGGADGSLTSKYAYFFWGTSTAIFESGASRASNASDAYGATSYHIKGSVFNGLVNGSMRNLTNLKQGDLSWDDTSPYTTQYWGFLFNANNTRIDNLTIKSSPLAVTTAGAEESRVSQIIMAFVSPTPSNATATTNTFFPVNITANDTTNNFSQAWAEVRHPNGSYSNYSMLQADLSGGGLPSKNISAFLNLTRNESDDTEDATASEAGITNVANAYDENWGSYASFTSAPVAARQINETYNLPIYHADAYWWQSKSGDGSGGGQTGIRCEATNGTWLIIRPNGLNGIGTNYTDLIPSECTSSSTLKIITTLTSSSGAEARYYEGALIYRYGPSELTNGTYLYRVYVNDTAGTSNNTDQRTIYVESPSTNPAVTITSPSNTSYLTLGPFWANATLVESIPNTTIAEIHSANGSIINLTMSNSSGNWNTQFYASPGSNYVRFISTDMLGNINGSETRYFTADNVSVRIMAPGNTTTRLVNQQTSFIFFPNSSALTPLNASLYIDGIRRAGNSSKITNQSNNTINYSAMALGNHSFYVQYCVSAGCVVTETWQYESTGKVAPIECSTSVPSGYTRIFTLNITNEDNWTHSNASINATIAWTFNFNDNGYLSNASITNTSVSRVIVCMDNSRLGETLDVDITYHSNPTYPTRYWYLRDINVSQDASNITASLLNSTVGSSVRFSLLDSNGAPASNYLLHQQRYVYGSDNAYLAMAMCKTDTKGDCILQVRANDMYYVFVAAAGATGALKEVFEPMLVTKDPTVLSLSAGLVNKYLSTLGSITTSCTNSSTTITCTIVDASGKIGGAIMHVWQLGANNYTYLGNTSAEGTSLTLTYVLPDLDHLYHFYVQAHYEQPQGVASFRFGNTESMSDYEQFGDTGLLAGGFMMLTLSMLSLWSPVMSMVALLAGWVIGAYLYLIAGWITYEEVTAAGGLIPIAGSSFVVIIISLVVWRLRMK